MPTGPFLTVSDISSFPFLHSHLGVSGTHQTSGLIAKHPFLGACCVANTSLKQDVCQVNGQQGRCVPAGVNNCTFSSLPPDNLAMPSTILTAFSL
jgi:hypothetical protein